MGRLVAPVDAVFDLLEESEAAMRRQAEALGLLAARSRRPPNS